MAIETIITALAALEAAITGVVKAYDNVPGGLNELPAFVNYPKSGRLHFSAAGGGQSDHTIVCELRYSKAITGEADKKLRPFIKLFRNKLAANLTISGTVDTVNDIRYDYGILPPIGGEEYMGVRFEVDVKETEAITVSA